MRKDRIWWPPLLAGSVLVLASVACGGFQLRSQAALTPTVAVQPAATPPVDVAKTQATVTPTPPPTATPSPSPSPTVSVGGLAPGKKARVATANVLNVRDQASIGGKQVGRLNPGTVITIKGGPSDADNYTWWEIDNGAGLTGWVSMGPAADPWLTAEDAAGVVTPATGGGRLVNRAIKVGDQVQVTTQEGKVLTVRDAAGLDARAAALALPGTLFTVVGGPEQHDDLTWWQIEGDNDVKGWAAESDNTDRWLTPVER